MFQLKVFKCLVVFNFLLQMQDWKMTDWKWRTKSLDYTPSRCLLRWTFGAGRWRCRYYGGTVAGRSRRKISTSMIY